MDSLVKYLKNRKLNIRERSKAASLLWEEVNHAQKELKKFKNELISMAKREGRDLEIMSQCGDWLCKVQIQPPTPKIEGENPEAIKIALGEQLFDQFIAHSFTLRWSEFRNAPPEVKKAFYSIPGIETTQTYQVKFLRLEKR